MRTEKAGRLITAVMHAWQTLSSEKDLSPHNPKINEALTTLVTGVIETYSPAEERAVLSDPQVKAVRPALLEKLAVAEGQMEKYWAEEFCARDHLEPFDF